MTRNSLMSTLTNMHAIGNESIDQAAPVVPETDVPQVEESFIAGDTPEQTTDLVLEEQAQADVVEEQNDVAIESLFLEQERNMRRAFALEELAEQLNETVQGDGQGISPVEAQLVTTSAELTDESGAQVAVESFNGNARIATEGLRDSVAEKAAQLRAVAEAAIGRAMRAATNTLTDVVEKVNGSHLRLMTYTKKFEALEGISGQQISDEKILARLRAHMPMDGDGNTSLDAFLKGGVLEAIRNINTMAMAASKLSVEMDPTRPERMMNGIAHFFKEAEKLKNGRMKYLDVKISVPESMDVDHLLAIPTVRNVATIDIVKGSGNQTYRVVTKDEINKMIDLVVLVRAELASLKNLVNGVMSNTSAPNHGRQLFNNRGDEEAMKMLKLRYKMNSLMSSVISRLVSDAVAIGGLASRHAVLVTAASFQAAGAVVDAADTSAA